MEKIYAPLIHIEEMLPILNQIAIFGGLTDLQLFKIFKLLKTVNYQEGEYVYKTGDAPSHIYIIEKGEIKIFIESQGTSLETATFHSGDCIGETSVIGIQPHSTSAFATMSTDLIVLEQTALLNIFESDKELFGMLILNIARETARRLARADQSIVNYILAEKK